MYPSSRGWTLVITEQVLQALMIVAVAMRMYTRKFIVRKVWIDDWLCLGAAIAAILLATDMTIQVVNGIGRHVDEVSKDPVHINRILKAFFGTLIIYNVALTLTKAAVVFQCLRFISHGIHRKVCWAVLGLVIVWGTATFFDSLFTCAPIRYFWDKTIEGGRCIDTQISWMTNAATDMATDLIIIVLPLPALRSLNLPKRQQMFLTLVFLMGILVVIISIIRLYSIHVIATSNDVTYDNVGAALWSCLEVQVGVICSCTVSLRPLVSRAFPSLMSNQSNRSPDNAPPTIGQPQSPRVRFRRFLDSVSALYTTRNPTTTRTRGQSTGHGLTQNRALKTEPMSRPLPAHLQAKEISCADTSTSSQMTYDSRGRAHPVGSQNLSSIASRMDPRESGSSASRAWVGEKAGENRETV